MRSKRTDVTEVELVGGVEHRKLIMVPYDTQWPQQFLAERSRIAAALRSLDTTIDHIGSTSVPFLVAKPIIDILVSVPDITAEADYLKPLLAAGYELRVREPGHRMLRTPTLEVHIHILERGHPGVAAYLQFRNRLRTDASDRELYARTKRALVEQDWADMNAYAEAKTSVIKDIIKRAQVRE